MEYVTKGLEPADALRYFEEISAIPRASQDEAAIANYICEFAKEHGLEYHRDDANNVIVRKPASKGCEDVEPLMLQGHTDMVCVKLPDCDHDFTKDPIELEIKDGWLTAKGTTLGADDGIAVAYMLAFLAKEDYVHPELECVFTSMEEIGLLGATALDASLLKSKRMINMDGGGSEEYMSVVSSAGGQVYDFYRKPEFVKAEGDAVDMTIRGLLGGHSAVTMTEGRGNALKLMARILVSLKRAMPIEVASFAGGMKMNAIVSDADAVVTVPAGKADEAMEIVSKVADDIKKEYAASDPGFTFACEKTTAEKVMSHEDSEALVNFMEMLPDGIHVMSQEIKDMIICSSNVGVLEMTEDGRIHVLDCIRSAEESVKTAISEKYELLASMCGFEAVKGTHFGSWGYDPASKLRAACSKVYEKLYGRPLEFITTHGGLECGEIKAKIPDLDIACMCATAEGAHTTDERLNLESFKRIYDCLLGIFEELCA